MYVRARLGGLECEGAAVFQVTRCSCGAPRARRGARCGSQQGYTHPFMLLSRPGQKTMPALPGCAAIAPLLGGPGAGARGGVRT